MSPGQAGRLHMSPGQAGRRHAFPTSARDCLHLCYLHPRILEESPSCLWYGVWESRSCFSRSIFHSNTTAPRSRLLPMSSKRKAPAEQGRGVRCRGECTSGKGSGIAVSGYSLATHVTMQCHCSTVAVQCLFQQPQPHESCTCLQVSQDS